MKVSMIAVLIMSVVSGSAMADRSDNFAKAVNPANEVHSTQRQPTAADVVNHDAHYNADASVSWGRGNEQAPDLAVGQETPAQLKGSHVGIATPQIASMATPEKAAIIAPDAVPQATPSKAPSEALQAPVAVPGITPSLTPVKAPVAVLSAIPSKAPAMVPDIMAKVPSKIDTGATINVAAATLSPSTKVEVTDPVTHTVKTVEAKTLPPTMQVAKPIVSAFVKAPHTSHSDHNGSSRGEHGTGNGGSNAQNSRSAGGLADSHIGGGRVGGGFHY